VLLLRDGLLKGQPLSFKDQLVYNRDMRLRRKSNIKTNRSINNVESSNRGRGRPREFDREQGLAKAMHLFWSFGYDAISMADLRAGLGITQASLYAAFGSKEQLFREAVDLYRRTAGFSTTRALATETSARKAIHAMLQAAVDAFSAPGAPGGCLLILGAINCAIENKAVQDHLLSIRRQISQSILERLKRGQLEGDVPKAAPIVAVAAYYSTVLHGLALQSRDGASRKTLTQVVQFAMADWHQMVSRAG
jgi:AcrR family transcriptional regulator